MVNSIEIINIKKSIQDIKHFFITLQNKICNALNQEDYPHQFKKDEWLHKEGGGGISCILTGDVIEKAAVNFSHVFGTTLPEAATLKRPDLKAAPFQALGVSVVIHPRNPYVPTSHMNVRFIVVEKEQPIWWFGGGFDLTPYYGFSEDCQHWHAIAKNICDSFGDDVYQQFKKNCDHYFYLKHRKEARGIGGIFFDDLNIWGFDQCFSFIQAVGQGFIDAYLPILTNRKTTIYSQREREFQLYRRGRYVEFNLLYDRGTLFGLQSGGRTESILMSLPPHASWQYNDIPTPNTPESKLYSDFLTPRDWV